MLKVKNNGNWDRTNNFFKKSIKITKFKNITLFAETCIERLKEATPNDSGLTAESWGYEITETKNKRILNIYNTNIQNGTKIVILLEFGHATASGSWVEGRPFVGKATQDAYDQILNDVWKEMKRL